MKFDRCNSCFLSVWPHRWSLEVHTLRFCDGDSLRRGAISSVCTFTFYLCLYSVKCKYDTSLFTYTRPSIWELHKLMLCNWCSEQQTLLLNIYAIVSTRCSAIEAKVVVSYVANSKTLQNLNNIIECQWPVGIQIQFELCSVFVSQSKSGTVRNQKHLRRLATQLNRTRISIRSLSSSMIIRKVSKIVGRCGSVAEWLGRWTCDQ